MISEKIFFTEEAPLTGSIVKPKSKSQSPIPTGPKVQGQTLSPDKEVLPDPGEGYH